jgi:hypothetical protein
LLTSTHLGALDCAWTHDRARGTALGRSRLHALRIIVRRSVARSIARKAPLSSSVSILRGRCRSSWLHSRPFSGTARFRRPQVGKHARRNTTLPPFIHYCLLSHRSSSSYFVQTAMVDWNSPAELAKDAGTSASRRPVHNTADAATAQPSPSRFRTSPSACTCGSSSSRSTLSGSSLRASASSDGRWCVVASRPLFCTGEGASNS